MAAAAAAPSHAAGGASLWAEKHLPRRADELAVAKKARLALLPLQRC